MAERHLRNDKSGDADARRRTDDSGDVRNSGGEPGQLLPQLAQARAKTRRIGVLGCDLMVGIEGSSLRVSPNSGVFETRRLGSQSQAGVAADARRQSSEYPSATFRGDHRERARVAHLSEFGAVDGRQRYQPTVG